VLFVESPLFVAHSQCYWLNLCSLWQTFSVNIKSSFFIYHTFSVICWISNLCGTFSVLFAKSLFFMAHFQCYLPNLRYSLHSFKSLMLNLCSLWHTFCVICWISVLYGRHSVLFVNSPFFKAHFQCNLLNLRSLWHNFSVICWISILYGTISVFFVEWFICV